MNKENAAIAFGFALGCVASALIWSLVVAAMYDTIESRYIQAINAGAAGHNPRTGKFEFYPREVKDE